MIVNCNKIQDILLENFDYYTLWDEKNVEKFWGTLSDSPTGKFWLSHRWKECWKILGNPARLAHEYRTTRSACSTSAHDRAAAVGPTAATATAAARNSWRRTAWNSWTGRRPPPPARRQTATRRAASHRSKWERRQRQRQPKQWRHLEMEQLLAVAKWRCGAGSVQSRRGNKMLE